MTLLNAAMLGALGLAVPLILLYLLKMKRQDRVIPSTLLWAKVIQDLQATHPFQKLQRNLLLFLQLLILVALCFALARPALSTARSEGRSLALIVDCSASMKAKDAQGGRRFDAAKKLALQVVESLADDGGQIMVVAAGHRTAVRVGLTADRVALRRALDLLSPEDARSDLNQALVLAAAALRGKAQPEVYLFSDGAGAQFDAIAGLGPVRFVRTGTTGANTAVTMLDVRPASPAVLADLKKKGKLDDGRFPFQVFVGLRNFGESAVKGYVTLHFEGDVAGAREVEIPAKGDASILFSDRFPPGLARINLEIEDALPEDNVAHFYVRPPREARVGLLNVRAPFFERAFKSFPFVEVSRINADALKTQAFDVVVSDGDVPDPLPDCPFVVFRPAKAVPDVSFGEPVKFPDVTDWAREHPLFRAVDFVDVHIAESLGVPQAPAGRVLLKGQAGLPLAVLSQRPGRPFRLAFGFALTDSDWPLRPSFPIFAWNLAQTSVEATTVVGASHFRTGALITLPALGTKAEVTTPSGAKHEVESAAADDPPPFTATTESGVYTADWGGERRIRFACNLLDERESDIRPAEELLVGGRAADRRDNVAFLHRELWPWIALAVLLIAMFEWYAFHRKIGS